MKLFITLVCYITATIFGIFAQSLAYFFHDYIEAIEPFTFIIIFSISSFVLYVFSFLYYFIACRKIYRLPHYIVVFLLLFFALPVTGWSFIVCMFWWG